MMKELVKRNRSYRRFYQDKAIEIDTLRELVDLARLCPCGRNMQGLKYMLFNDAESNLKISKNLFWAGYLKDWNGPEEGEKPSAYIIMLRDKSIGSTAQDEGIAMQTILLGAVEKGLGGCVLGNINRVSLKEQLSLDDRYELAYVLAIGHPKEVVIIEDIKEDGDVKYWHDENDANHVPKRSLSDLIIEGKIK